MPRKIHTTKVGKCAVTIYRDSFNADFIVRRTMSGRTDKGYFTEDKQDARDTAAYIARGLRHSPACIPTASARRRRPKRR